MNSKLLKIPPEFCEVRTREAYSHHKSPGSLKLLPECEEYKILVREIKDVASKSCSTAPMLGMLLGVDGTWGRRDETKFDGRYDYFTELYGWRNDGLGMDTTDFSSPTTRQRLSDEIGVHRAIAGHIMCPRSLVGVLFVFPSVMDPISRLMGLTTPYAFMRKIAEAGKRFQDEIRDNHPARGVSIDTNNWSNTSLKGTNRNTRVGRIVTAVESEMYGSERHEETRDFITHHRNRDFFSNPDYWVEVVRYMARINRCQT